MAVISDTRYQRPVPGDYKKTKNKNKTKTKTKQDKAKNNNNNNKGPFHSRLTALFSTQRPPPRKWKLQSFSSTRPEACMIYFGRVWGPQ